MIDGDKNRRIAEFLRQMGRMGFIFDAGNIAKAIGAGNEGDEGRWMKLADLIDRPAMRKGSGATKENAR